MEICVRMIGKLAIVYGWDGGGMPLPPDIGIDGYHRTMGIVKKRRLARNDDRIQDDTLGIVQLLEAAENGEPPIPEGYSASETVNPSGESEFRLFDEWDDEVAGPFPSLVDILASARHLK